MGGDRQSGARESQLLMDAFEPICTHMTLLHMGDPAPLPSERLGIWRKLDQPGR
jgi:hypothetical protein